MRMIVGLLGMAACAFPTPSQEYVCRETADCEGGRVCEKGYCITSTVDAGLAPDGTSAVMDAMPVDAPPVDAGPITMTFTVGAECPDALCYGGYDGIKYPAEGGADNAQYLCTQRGYPSVVDYTIANIYPGGEFCAWDPPGWYCESDCDGCNPIDTVTCRNP